MALGLGTWLSKRELVAMCHRYLVQVDVTSGSVAKKAFCSKKRELVALWFGSLL